jgi:hypothetical protein
VPEKSYLL